MTFRKNERVYILLGSNIEPEKNLTHAANCLDEIFGIKRFSSIWQSPPYGMNGPCFLNAVVEIDTLLTPDQLKFKHLRKIEAKLGRIRSGDKFTPRTIDLDIVAVGSQVVDEETWHLDHIAIPLCELAPNLLNPLTGKSLKSIVDNLRSGSKLIKREDIQLFPASKNLSA